MKIRVVIVMMVIFLIGSIGIYGKEQDLKGGEQIEYYKDGSIKSKYTYTAGKVEGKWRRYTSDGVLWEETIWKDGSGKSINYNKDGKMELYAEYKNRLLDGDYRAYYRNGVLKEKRLFKKGRVEGRWTEYYESGKIWKVKEYEGGSLKSLATYREDGSIYTRVYRQDRKIFRRVVEYEESGKKIYGVPTSEIEKKDGKVYYKGKLYTGTVYDVDNDSGFVGEIEGKEEYKGGVLDGKKIGYYYYSTGGIREEIPYKDGDIDGTYREYYENGNVKEKRTFIEGREEGYRIQYDEDGNEVKTVMVRVRKKTNSI